MKTTFVCFPLFLVATFAGAFLPGCAGENIDEPAEREEEEGAQSQDGHGEGPWIGGVFDRRDAGSSNAIAVDAESIVPEEPTIIDENRETNEVIVLMNRDEGALRRAVGAPVSFPAERFPEDALVRAVRQREPRVLARFGAPLGARHVRGADRTAETSRREAAPDSAEDRINRYVVLRYESVEKARLAAASMRDAPGIEHVSHSRAASFAAVPNDPYVPVKSVAAQYQWGMHAMSFPAAWDLTPGNAWLGAVDSAIVAGHEDLTNVRSHLSFELNPNPVTFHGTHVVGIMAATQNNAKGVSGGCPSCSVVVATSDMTPEKIRDSIKELVNRGVQVINLSFQYGAGNCQNLGDPGTSLICQGISFAAERYVLLVAAAGNFNQPTRFPASDPRVLAVGGVENVIPAFPAWWQKWYYSPGIGSSGAGENGVVAPAKAIVSTAPISSNYPAYQTESGTYYCSDAAYDESGVQGDGYGSCMGTSMAAPHVSALAGLIRSVKPSLSHVEVQNIIRQAGSNYPSQSTTATKDQEIGYGVPNAYAAVMNAYNQTPNRLAPLFSFYSAGRLDYFYTTVPQMASAALVGTLQPGVGPNPPGYVTVGTGIVNFAGFPGVPPVAGRVPSAQVWVFTTPQNPKSAAIPLAPLYRLSWKCGDPGYSPACAGTPTHTDFVYTADPAGVDAFKSWGYKLDGIEGYIYPKTIPQPPGTVRLMRKYNAGRDDHAIFPETMLFAMWYDGYMYDSGSDWLGYVYPNVDGTVPAIQ